MKHFMTAAMLAVFLTTLITASGQDRKRQVDNLIKAEMAKLHIPGAAVAVLRNGKIELLKGYGLGNIERKIPVTPNTMFQIASTTKPFTAICVMMLIEEGKVSLDEKAMKYLPWLPAIYSEVTVRQLLTHTSGVNRDVRTANVDNFTIDEFKRRFAAAPTSFKPGEKWEYSNNGYILLGLIVEAVSGKSFGEYLAQRITRPLGMNNTRYNEPPTDKIKNRAIGYDWLENTYKPSSYFSGGYTGGAIISTVSDMAKWEQALSTGKLLRQSSFEQIWTPVNLINGQPRSFEFRGEQSGYGFGWFLTSYKGRKLFTHGGTVSGFSGQIHRFVDDKVTIIVLTNSKSGADRIGFAEVLARGIADLYFAAAPKTGVD